MTIPAAVGEAVSLVSIIQDGNEALYPQVEIYATGGASPLTTINLTHRAKGRYEGVWTPSSVGAYTALFITYTDSGHTIESLVYMREAEQIFVSQNSLDDLATSIVRALGLLHENAFIDNTTFDTNSQLLTCRVRLFDSKANAQAATDGGSETTGLVSTYSVEATYESKGKMRQYRMVRE